MIIPHQRITVTLAARLIAPPMTSLAAKETAPQRQIPRPQPGRQLSFHTGFQQRLRACEKTLIFRVGARLGKIKREELDNASTVICGNVPRFTRTFEQYIKEIRPDSTKEEVIELCRELFSDTMNFGHRQVLQISALHMFLREVLFAYGAVEKSVDGGYIPSRLIKVLVPDKEEYEILADILREERAKNARDSGIDDDDLQRKTSNETYRAQRTRIIDRDDKKIFLYHASAVEISSALEASRLWTALQKRTGL
jgi:hypothetical protein